MYVWQADTGFPPCVDKKKAQRLEGFARATEKRLAGCTDAHYRALQGRALLGWRSPQTFAAASFGLDFVTLGRYDMGRANLRDMAKG